MDYNFKKLSEVDALTEVPEGANALIEINGEIKRVPGSGLGGATGIKTAIIKDSEYDNMISNLISGGAAPAIAAPAITYECINMTFEEAYETMKNGEPLSVFGMFNAEGTTNMYGISAFAGTTLGVPCIVIAFGVGSSIIAQLFWTVDGLSTEEPLVER